jgi:hypothetical protein
VLTRVFGSKRDEVTGGWRKLHNEELHNLYSSPNIIRMMKSRRMRWAGHTSRKRREAHKILVGKPKGKSPFGRPRRGLENNIKMQVTEIQWELADWIRLTQDKGAVTGSCEHGNKPSGSIKGREFLDYLSVLSFVQEGTLLHGISYGLNWVRIMSNDDVF